MQGRQGEAVSIQPGQPYSEGIRSVIQSLPGTREGQSRHYQCRGSLKQDACSQHGFASLIGQASSGALARTSQDLGASTFVYRMRNIRLQPGQSSTRSIYSAMLGLPRGLIQCRPAHDVVFLKQSQFCSPQKDFSARWEIPTSLQTHSPVYI